MNVMKKILIILTVLLTAKAYSQEIKDSIELRGDTASVQLPDTAQKKGPVLEFAVTEITDTVVVETSNTVALKEKKYKYAEYSFKNTGDEPLIIQNISQPSPCFTTEWPRKPIPPGEGGVIKFTCPGKPEGENMIIGFTVTSNDPGGIKLLMLKRHFITKN